MSSKNPILLDLPSAIETPRLQLRVPRPGDGFLLNKAVKNSYPELSRWLPWCKELPSPESTEEFCREGAAGFYAKGKSFGFLVALRETQELIGSSGFPKIDWEVPWVEIGYWISTAYSGKGYATEAAKALIDYAFREIKAVRVEIQMDAGNAASKKVAAKLGVEYEGTCLANARDNSGRLTSTARYAVLAKGVAEELAQSRTM